MTRAKFDLFTEPHVADVGEWEFKFYPEIVAKEVLGPYRELLSSVDSGVLDITDTEEDPAKIAAALAAGEKTSEGIRNILLAIMLPESKELFASVKVPDRTCSEIFRWIMEVYGGTRPTGPSNGSLQRASNNGEQSTGNSATQDPQTRPVGESVVS